MTIRGRAWIATFRTMGQSFEGASHRGGRRGSADAADGDTAVRTLSAKRAPLSRAAASGRSTAPDAPFKTPLARPFTPPSSTPLRHHHRSL